MAPSATTKKKSSTKIEKSKEAKATVVANSSAEPTAPKTSGKKSAKSVKATADKATASTVQKKEKKAIGDSALKKPAQPKEESVVVVKKSASKPTTMADLMAEHEKTIITPQKGQMVTGTIVGKNRRSLIVDIGAKTEGMVTDREFSFSQDFIDSLKVGDSIEAQVVSIDPIQGHVLLSLRTAALDARWLYFQDAMDKNETLEAKAIDVNKGGLIVLVNGLRGFIPSSQFGKQYAASYMSLKGASLQVKAIEVDREKNRLIFSERHVSEASDIAMRDAAMNSVLSGEIVEGIVSGVMPFGLFVTVKIPVKEGDKESKVEVEGLVHISEISWEKVTHPKEYHNSGDKIKVKVLGVDDRTGKLNLSIKQLSDDPWVTIEDRYEPGMTVDGKVSRVESFGVFVNVETGVDGLIHSSKLEPGSQLKKGDTISVHVESVDAKLRRMSLSVVSTEVPMGYK